MRSLRSAFSRFILSGVICCAIVLGLPTSALAEWVTYSSNPYGYWVNSTTLPTTFKVSPIVTDRGGYSYSTVRSVSSYYVNNSANPLGTSWNTVPSVSKPWFIRFISAADGTLAEGNVIKIGNNGVLTVMVSPNAAPTSYNYVDKECIQENPRYFVSETGNTNLTEVYPNTHGVFVMPFDAQFFFVCTQVSLPSISGAWYCSGFSLQFERPEDQNEVAAIEDQTEQLTSTTGSDTVTSDVTSQYTQQVEGLQLFQFVENLDETFANTLTTQETDSSVHFPGMNLAGFQIPEANVDPLQLVPADLVTPIKMIVTFTFCSAFISHIISLLHAIFEIYDYANGVWVDAATEGDRVTSAVTLSGWE